jgi:3-oxoacyl-[acyl-carrier-protein] synthase II/nodulation protein E
MQRVVITGLGCVTPIGKNPQELWQSLEDGRSGIAPLFGELDPTLKFKAAAQISDLDLSSLSSAQLQSTERCSQLAILTARQAEAEARLTQHHDPAKIAIILGCSTNGRQAEEPETAKLYLHNARVHPLTIARSMASNGVSQVAIDRQITGPALTISTACASGAHAIGMAFHMVRSGMVTAAVAGGHEAPLTKGFLRAWDSMRVVSPTSCRPFSGDRDGMTLGEGAAVLALETLAHARARGATIYAEILGFGMTADAHHITQPRADGPAQAMLAALKDAAETLHATDQPGTLQSLHEGVGYINAHGTATPTNDAVEAAAIRQVFGSRAGNIPISGTKGAHGHSLGASSAIEALITTLALHHRRLPFTCGTSSVDPALRLDIILNEPRAIEADRPNVALTHSLAFGGLNAILCLRTAPQIH